MILSPPFLPSRGELDAAAQQVPLPCNLAQLVCDYAISLEVVHTKRASAFLTPGGTVRAWGHQDYGGMVPEGLVGVQCLCATETAFAALLEDRSVVVWGPRVSFELKDVLRDVVWMESGDHDFVFKLASGAIFILNQEFAILYHRGEEVELRKWHGSLLRSSALLWGSGLVQVGTHTNDVRVYNDVYNLHPCTSGYILEYEDFSVKSINLTGDVVDECRVLCSVAQAVHWDAEQLLLLENGQVLTFRGNCVASEVRSIHQRPSALGLMKLCGEFLCWTTGEVVEGVVQVVMVEDTWLLLLENGSALTRGRHATPLLTLQQDVVKIGKTSDKLFVAVMRNRAVVAWVPGAECGLHLNDVAQLRLNDRSQLSAELGSGQQVLIIKMKRGLEVLRLSSGYSRQGGIGWWKM